MAQIDLTDAEGNHHRFLNAEARILRPAQHYFTDDRKQVVYDGTWVVEIRTQPDENGDHDIEWADGYQPADFKK